MRPPPLPTQRRIALGVTLLAAGMIYASCVRSSRRAARAAATLAACVERGDLVLAVPHAPGGITLDGDTDDPGWLRPPGPARTGDFVFPDGKPARPYSAARLVWGGEYLYLALYASDEDIESHTDRPGAPLGLDDGFRVVFSQGSLEYAIEVTPKALMTDSMRRGGGAWDFGWSSDAHASREIDGSPNDPRHVDEEWSIEMAVPFKSLGMRGEPGENIGLSIHRCDSPLRGPRVCEGWGEGASDHEGPGRGRIVLE